MLLYITFQSKLRIESLLGENLKKQIKLGTLNLPATEGNNLITKMYHHFDDRSQNCSKIDQNTRQAVPTEEEINRAIDKGAFYSDHDESNLQFEMTVPDFYVQSELMPGDDASDDYFELTIPLATTNLESLPCNDLSLAPIILTNQRITNGESFLDETTGELVVSSDSIFLDPILSHLPTPIIPQRKNVRAVKRTSSVLTSLENLTQLRGEREKKIQNIQDKRSKQEQNEQKKAKSLEKEMTKIQVRQERLRKKEEEGKKKAEIQKEKLRFRLEKLQKKK